MKLAKPDLDSMLLEQSLRDLQDSDELEKLFRPYAFKNKAPPGQRQGRYGAVDPEGRGVAGW